MTAFALDGNAERYVYGTDNGKVRPDIASPACWIEMPSLMISSRSFDEARRGNHFASFSASLVEETCASTEGL